MSNYQMTFQRYEMKYLLKEHTYRQLRTRLEGKTAEDQYGKTTICNIYFDTPDARLVRNSLEKPIYKEKLRLRSYGAVSYTHLETGMMTEKERNTGIDLMRLIAALMVVAIHTYPLASLSETGDFLVTRVLCRVAVPFFFMVTGYYVLPGCLKKGKGSRKLAGWFQKTSLLYGAAVLILSLIHI